MKILIISHEYPPIGGGGANACMYLAREYSGSGHSVNIITAWYKGLAVKETICDYGTPIHVTRVMAKRKNMEHCGFAEMMDFLLKAIRVADKSVKNAISSGEPYDICQIFFGIPSGPAGYLLKRKYGLPYVIRFGGGDIPGFQDRFGRIYSFIGPALWRIWKRADGLVANSEGLRELARGFCDKYPILVFPNGVDTDFYYPLTSKSYDRNSLELLFVSRLIERKGLQYVIPGLKKLQNETGKQIHLTIVGDGPYRQTLEELSSINSIGDMITFEGQKDKDELLPYYQKGDLFIFPSKKEGMPNAVLEAMACGLPVVMSPCQGSRELIDGNGIIAESDLTRFNEALGKAVCMEPDKIAEMGACSRDRACRMFSWRSVADSYLKLFGKVLETNNEYGKS